MKTIKNLLYTCLFAGTALLAACEKQNIPVPEPVTKLVPVGSDAYYENLRAYKRSDHQVYFGWWGGLGTPGSPETVSVIDHIPDSVDIVSMWGGVPPFGSHNFETMQRIRTQKATRFVWVVFDNTAFLNSMADTAKTLNSTYSFADQYDKGDDQLNIGFELIATRLRDSIDKYQLDGLDLDHEPTVCGCNWGLLTDQRKYGMFIKVLSKYFGPLSGTDKLLIVDGEWSRIPADAGIGLSYAVSQAYNTTSPASLQNRYNSGVPWLLPHRYIVTENFEERVGWELGGPNFTDPIRGVIPSLLGMAYWNPIQGRKGGAGTYHAEYEYAINPDYRWTRQAIQIMNPAVR